MVFLVDWNGTVVYTGMWSFFVDGNGAVVYTGTWPRKEGENRSITTFRQHRQRQLHGDQSRRFV